MKKTLFIAIGICLLLVFNNVVTGFEVPEGIEFSAVILKDRWDMQNSEDVYPLPWANNLASWDFEDGVLTGVCQDNDPFFWLLFPGVVSSLKLGKVGENYPIDTSLFHKLAFFMWLPDDLSPNEPGGVIYWHKGGETQAEFDGNYGHTDFFPVYPGWHLYVLDLKEMPYAGVPYDGIVKGLRIDPCVTCKKFKIGWVRLIAPEVYQQLLVLPDSPQTIVVDTDRDFQNGFLTTLQANNGGFDCSILPPGTYYIAKIPDIDYATTVLGNSWDMKDQTDVSLVNGFVDVSFGENGFKGKTANNDPFLVMNVSSIHPIDAQKYRYLIIDMAFDYVPSQEAGIVVYWGNESFDFSYHSDFIPIQTGRKRYVIDMASYTGWSGEIKALRIDPCSTGGLMVNIYSVLLSKRPDVTLADVVASYYEEALDIVPTPVGEVISPSAQDGEDYATVVLGNPWEFDDMYDVKRVDNVSSYELTNVIPDLGIEGSFLHGVSAPAPTGEWGDPGVYVLLQENARPLDADKYHWLILRMYVPGELDLASGAMARIAWKADDWDPGLTTDDIVLYPGLQEYVFDLKKARWEPPSDRRWTGFVRYLRIDPHEFPEARDFYIDALYVRADSESKGIFPISFYVEGGGNLKADIYYDTDNTGFDGVPIVTDLPVESGQTYTFYWDTHNVAAGSYYIYVILHNQWQAVPYYSKAPLVVVAQSPLSPVSFTYQVSADRTVSLSWSAPQGVSVIGYNLYVGFSPDWMAYKFPLGNVTQISFSDVPSGDYFVAITAELADGQETPIEVQHISVP